MAINQVRKGPEEEGLKNIFMTLSREGGKDHSYVIFYK